MRHPTPVLFVVAILVALSNPAAAQDPKPITDLEKTFAGRLFAGDVSPQKNYACFVRRYDSAHLARHPLQKVSAMRVLVTGEKTDDAPFLGYSFRMGVKFVKRPGDFDSSGGCGSPGVEDGTNKVVFSCGVDCDGGGISVELNKDNQSTLVRLERIRIWQNNKPEDEGLDLSGGADDKVFRLDRAKLEQCKSLISDRKELAEIRSLKNKK